MGRQDHVRFPRDGAFGHVHDGGDVLLLGAAITQRGERVRRLARLRDEDRETAFRHRGFAVTELGGDVDLDRHARDALQPDLGHEARIIGRAAGNDRDARHSRQIEGQVRQADPALQRMEIGVERVADHRRLLVDFLEHEVAVIAFVDQVRIELRQLHRTLHDVVVLVVDHDGVVGQLHPVAFVEIGDLVRERGERQRVGTEIHLAVAVAHRERAAAPGADHEVVMAAEDDRDGERALEALQGLARPPPAGSDCCAGNRSPDVR